MLTMVVTVLHVSLHLNLAVTRHIVFLCFILQLCICLLSYCVHGVLFDTAHCFTACSDTVLLYVAAAV